MQSELTRVVGPIVDRALLDGMGSAIALGVITTSGERAVLTRGTTLRVRRRQGRLVTAAGLPISRTSVFDLASLTKPMVTSTLLAQAVTSGKIDLAQPLAHGLPAARDTSLGGQSVRSLLAHGSGALAWRDFYADTAGLSPDARQAAICSAVLNEPLAHPPGSKAVYSDLGFIALGLLLEAVYDTPLDQLFAERIAAPLGLSSAVFRRVSAKPASGDAVVATEVWPPRCPLGDPLQGVVHDDNCAGLDGVAGHAGLFSTVDDVLTWALTWLLPACGVTAIGALPPSLVAAWVSTAAADETTWRCGFDTPSTGYTSAGSLASVAAFGHLGFTGTSVWMDPSRQAAVVLLTNRVHPSRDQAVLIRQLRPALHDTIWRLLDERPVDVAD
ncbi:MAG: beta-lactamase family protein [Myxococcales bacterium]|nr:beta-lactamase family protein [Myxococcales bacterium]